MPKRLSRRRSQLKRRVDGKKSQERRFKERIENPIKRWKLSPMDLKSREHCVEYSRAKDIMQQHTDTLVSPWNIVDADNKKKARLNFGRILPMVPWP
ncbi:hypothetical protein RFN29_35395, partial [Mesorhizobium sp. VK22B]|nr:hypothetical protein [Mesorhizobium sp. VK22B]